MGRSRTRRSRLPSAMLLSPREAMAELENARQVVRLRDEGPSTRAVDLVGRMIGVHALDFASVEGRHGRGRRRRDRTRSWTTSRPEGGATVGHDWRRPTLCSVTGSGASPSSTDRPTAGRIGPRRLPDGPGTPSAGRPAPGATGQRSRPRTPGRRVDPRDRRRGPDDAPRPRSRPRRRVSSSAPFIPSIHSPINGDSCRRSAAYDHGTPKSFRVTCPETAWPRMFGSSGSSSPMVARASVVGFPGWGLVVRTRPRPRRRHMPAPSRPERRSARHRRDTASRTRRCRTPEARPAGGHASSPIFPGAGLPRGRMGPA